MSDVQNPYDRSAKLLCRQHPADFLRLVFPDLDPATLRIDNPELNVAEKRADEVFYLDDKTACVIEFMIEPDSRMLRSFFIKTAMAAEVVGEKVDVLLLIYYLTSGGFNELPAAHETRRGRAHTTFACTAEGLWNYREAIEAGEYPALAPFLTLWARPEDVEATLQRVKRIVLAEPDRRLRADLLSVAATVAGRVVRNKQRLLSLFKEELKMLQESTIVDDWIQEGVEKGLREGLQKGELAASKKYVREVLETRFDLVPSALGRQIDSLTDADLLDQLHRLAIKVSSVEEFQAKLAAILQKG